MSSARPKEVESLIPYNTFFLVLFVFFCDIFRINFFEVIKLYFILHVLLTLLPIFKFPKKSYLGVKAGCFLIKLWYVL